MNAPLIYSFTLTQCALAVGLLFLAGGGHALYHFADTEKRLRSFPRHRVAGLCLAVLALVWFLWLLWNMDLMEYTPHRPKFLIGFSVLGIASMVYLRDFLSVRALAVLLLMGAKVLLDAAFLRDETSRLVLTVLAYVWVIVGMTLTAWPYVMRDALSWMYRVPVRARIFYAVGMGVGILLIGLALTSYRH